MLQEWAHFSDLISRPSMLSSMSYMPMGPFPSNYHLSPPLGLCTGYGLFLYTFSSSYNSSLFGSSLLHLNAFPNQNTYSTHALWIYALIWTPIARWNYIFYSLHISKSLYQPPALISVCRTDKMCLLGQESYFSHFALCLTSRRIVPDHSRNSVYICFQWTKNCNIFILIHLL